MKNIITWLLFALIAGLALFLRVEELDRRVLHNDEANQICKAGKLLDENYYRYDPHDHHGPTLYYFSLPFAWMSPGSGFVETSAAAFRAVPVFFGMGLIVMLLLVRGGIGWGAVLAAGLLTAISTAMTYYSRFFIQEIILVFFAFGAIISGWYWLKKKSIGCAVAAGLCLGLMHATKETCIISYAAMGFGLFVTVLWNRGRKVSINDFKISPLDFGAAFAAGLIISMLFFSSFFSHPMGIIDSFRTYLVYLGRGGGEEGKHILPFFHYLKMLTYHKDALVWSEALIILLGLVGMVLVFVKARVLDKLDMGLLRFLVVYTLFLTIAYSAIKYKTPWCLLSFYHGWILLAGVGTAGIVKLLRKIPLQIAFLLFLSFFCWKLVKQTRLSTLRFGADERNPYAYVHTNQTFMRLVERVYELTDFQDAGNSMRVAVISNVQDFWPLPFYLRGYDQIGYFGDTSSIPEGFNPCMIIASRDRESIASAYAGERYNSAEYFGLRPGALLALYVRKDIWAKFMESRQ